jgi:hypothetical protein
MSRDHEKEIRENWFKDHKAVLTKHGDLQVLDWREPGTNIFAVRYVFDGYKMYVSGDLGSAVFRFSQSANPFCLSGYSLSYFEEKMEAFQNARRDFNEETAKKYLDDWKKENEDEDSENINYVKDLLNDLYRMIDDCSSVKEWESKLSDFDINKFSPSAWEWLPGIGDEIPLRVRSYLIGIKMAVDQING